MSDLKPCAHCGGESVVGYYPETPGMEHEPWAAHCDKCKAVIWAKTKDKAIEAWNRRRTVNLTEAVDAICGEMCGDGWDWHNRAEAVVKTVAEMCGAKVVND